MTDAVLIALVLGACALGTLMGLVQAVRTRSDGITTAALAGFAFVCVLMACGAVEAAVA